MPIKLKASFFNNNRKYVLENLPKNSIAFINSNDELPRNGSLKHVFRQNSNLFYLTGINQEQTFLILSPNHPDSAKRELLFVRPTNERIAIWEGAKLSKAEVTEISGVENIKYVHEFELLLADLMFYAENVYISTNENLSYSRFYNDADLRFIDNLKIKYPLHSYKRLSPIITKKRLVKEDNEIEMMQEACRFTKQAFERVLKFTKPDVAEYEIQAEITHEFIRNNVKSHAYQPIIASGKNACTLHYISNNNICKSGDLVLMDFGAEYRNYAADLSRTIPINGKFTERQKEIYKVVLKVLKKSIELMVIGKTLNILNKEVGKIMQDELLKLKLISESDIKKQKKDKPAYKKYFMHGISHFMGLDVHDVGTKDTKFEAGMVLSCEPGIYIAEENLGVRLENDILITNGKPINLMTDIPIEINEIEKMMEN